MLLIFYSILSIKNFFMVNKLENIIVKPGPNKPQCQGTFV